MGRASDDARRLNDDVATRGLSDPGERAFEYWRNVDKDIGARIDDAVG